MRLEKEMEKTLDLNAEAVRKAKERAQARIISPQANK
jgi:hypothetical protein